MSRSHSTKCFLARATILAVVAVASLEVGGCAVCRCPLRGEQIGVPASRAADVSSVTANGPACDGVVVRCSGTNPCLSYQVLPVAEGACTVTFSFTSGATPVRFDLDFVNAPIGSCCGGLHRRGSTGPLSVPDLADGSTGD